MRYGVSVHIQCFAAHDSRLTVSGSPKGAHGTPIDCTSGASPGTFSAITSIRTARYA